MHALLLVVLSGGRQSGGGSRGSEYCILDCVYDEIKQIYYVLDLMCWKGQPLYDSDTEFRFFWLQAKVADELPDLKIRSKANPCVFEVYKKILSFCTSYCHGH